MKKEDELKDELLSEGRDTVCDCIKSRKKKYDASEMKVDGKNEEIDTPPAKKMAQVKDEVQEIKSPEDFTDEIEDGEIIDEDIIEFPLLKKE